MLVDHWTQRQDGAGVPFRTAERTPCRCPETSPGDLQTDEKGGGQIEERENVRRPEWDGVRFDQT